MLIMYRKYASLTERIIWLTDIGEAKEEGKVYTSTIRHRES
jgi:hypothetical protein